MLNLTLVPSDKVVKYLLLMGFLFVIFRSSSLVIADFGCGECKIAQSVKNKVHCFDLAPVCDLVTVCDMANVSFLSRHYYITYQAEFHLSSMTLY